MPIRPAGSTPLKILEGELRWGGRGRGRFPDPSSRSLAYAVCYLSCLLSVHLSVRPCFCLCACSPVVGNTSSSMSACAAFGHPTHPGPQRFSHPAKSKFFSFLSESEGNGKKWICRPDQKASPEPSKAQSKSLSRAHRQRKSAANPPLIRANPRKSAPRFAIPLLFALPGP